MGTTRLLDLHIDRDLGPRAPAAAMMQRRQRAACWAAHQEMTHWKSHHAEVLAKARIFSDRGQR
jgi:hypothetical protein